MHTTCRPTNGNCSCCPFSIISPSWAAHICSVDFPRATWLRELSEWVRGQGWSSSPLLTFSHGHKSNGEPSQTT